jgi:hypothetical protein
MYSIKANNSGQLLQVPPYLVEAPFFWDLLCVSPSNETMKLDLFEL